MEQYVHIFYYNFSTIAGVVLMASTIAFQAIGTGSNPVTRSNYLLIAKPEKSTLLHSKACPDESAIPLSIYLV